jgi:ornithine decarboxylase
VPSAIQTREVPAPSAGLSATALEALGIPTPFLACDPSVLADQHGRLAAALPSVAIHYAVKCNPAPAVLSVLAGSGCHFEVASIRELEMVEATGTPPSEVLFSNPVKPSSAIAAAHDRGLHRFAFDSESEVRKLAEHAPGSSVYVRLAVDDSNSLFPLSRKFGAEPEEAHRLLLLAGSLGLVPYGVTFHVGSQCTDAGAWGRAIGRCGALMTGLVEDGVTLEMVDIGGGFPVRYSAAERVPSLGSIARRVTAALASLPYAPRVVVAEPGRFLAAASGVMVASVIGLATRADGLWAYLDVGGYNGLMEAVQTGGRWQFPLSTGRSRTAGCEDVPFTVTGPTCDASDTMFYGVPLPADLAVGDRIHITMAGAYSLSYASSFNGFPPPELVIVGADPLA